MGSFCDNELKQSEMSTMVYFQEKETWIIAIFKEKLQKSQENDNAKCAKWFYVIAPLIWGQKTLDLSTRH